MAVYSTNQNRQLYVANHKVDATPSTLGDVQVKTDADNAIYLLQLGHGGLVRSDLIYPESIMWANATAPADTEIKLKAFEVDLTADGSTGTGNDVKPISGQDYILRVNFNQMYGMSDEDIYQKYGAVHATSAMTKADFFKAMAYSLCKNFRRLYQPLVEIAVGTSIANAKSNKIARASKAEDGTIKLYKENGTEITVSGDVKLYILEKTQVEEWALGTKQYTPVYFKPFATTIFKDGDEAIWGKVTDVTKDYAETVGNGYKYADLEYFCMGERGDQYRNIGWPKVIQTKYFVNPTNTYYTLDIHYAYQGNCEDIQKSEKTLTILATDKSVITGIITGMGIDAKVDKTTAFVGTTTTNP